MDQQILRTVMNINAGFSGVSGLIMVVSPGQVAKLLGLSSSGSYILMIGLGLVLFAMGMIYFNRKPKMDPKYVLTIITADTLWVVGSVALLVGSWLPFTTSGMWAIGLVAAVVDVFATLQFLGWRRL